MLLYQMHNIDYASIHSHYNRFVRYEDCSQMEAEWNLFNSYWLDSGSEMEHWIQILELLFDDAYCSKVIDDNKSWFHKMQVPDLYYPPLFFTTDSWGRQPSTFWFIHLLTPETFGTGSCSECIMRWLNMPLERRLRLYCLKMNIAVNVALPQQ